MDIHQTEECLHDAGLDYMEIIGIKYGTRADLIEGLKDFYFKKGYILTIRSSRKDKYVTLGCDRGGVYRDRLKIPMEDRQRKTRTRLIDCPFEVQGKRDGDIWIVVMKKNWHNHEVSSDICGHPAARVLSNEELTVVGQMTRAGIEPKQILSSLRQNNPNLQAVSRNIYNARCRIHKQHLAGRSSIQALYEELGKEGFIFDINQDGMGRLTHLFFAHPMSIKLSRSYSHVFVMDCTYKTNRYKMPLLEIIGITSFNTSFYSSFVFLKNEGCEDYIWALKTFAKVIGENCSPSVIVTDREFALMGAIKVVFSKSVNLLCVWHVEKNIVSNCRKSFEKKEDFDELLSAWNEIVYSSTEEEFMRYWEEFQVSYQHKNDILNYIKKVWIPLKEKFVSAWTEEYLHFGNRATSRAEGAHSKLKKYLLISTCDLGVVKDKMCLLIDNDRQEIKTQLASERLLVPLNCNIPFFKDVVTRISSFALEKIHEQYEKFLKNTLTSMCTGKFVATMGLPCAHMMISWKESGIPLASIHSQWRIDTRSSLLADDGFIDGDNSLDVLLSKLNDKYKQLPLVEQQEMHEKISQLVCSSLPSIFEPSIQTTRGRPSSGKKKDVSSSTRRDPSRFEVVERSRKCSHCKETTHDIRTCPTKNKRNYIHVREGSSSQDTDIFSFDMTPNMGSSFNIDLGLNDLC